VLELESLETRASRGIPVPVCVHHQLGPALQNPVRRRIHVADDQVGLQAALEERVASAVDPDQDGPEIPDVGTDRLEVAAVVRAAHDDQRVAVAKVGSQVRDLELPDQDLALLADVYERVLGEVLDRLSDPVLLLALDRGQLLERPHLPLGDEAARPDHGPPRHDHHVAVAQVVEQGRADRVDKMHARADEDQRAWIRVPAAGRRRDVDDPPHAALDEVLGRHPVEVPVVDDRDVPGAEPPDQVLCTPSEPSLAADLERRPREAVVPGRRARCRVRGRQGRDSRWLCGF
jgi:hypothetical protein